MKLALLGSRMSSRVSITVEELANVATHGFGLVVSLAALPIFILLAARGGDLWTIIGVAVFGATLVGAYGASTVYHAMPSGPHKERWLRLDQSAVYLLIAGTYTPFTLGALRGPWGWSLFSLIWLGALIGIYARVGLRLHRPKLENLTYLAMGWLVLVAVDPLLKHIGWAGLGWLLAGGIAYSLGVVFLSSRARFGHCAWHVFVLGGSACHAIAVLGYGINSAAIVR